LGSGEGTPPDPNQVCPPQSDQQYNFFRAVSFSKSCFVARLVFAESLPTTKHTAKILPPCSAQAASYFRSRNPSFWKEDRSDDGEAFGHRPHFPALSPAQWSDGNVFFLCSTHYSPLKFGFCPRLGPVLRQDYAHCGCGEAKRIALIPMAALCLFVRSKAGARSREFGCGGHQTDAFVVSP